MKHAIKQRSHLSVYLSIFIVWLIHPMTGTGATKEDAELADMTERVAKIVSEIRGLKLLKPIRVEYQKKEKIRSYIAQRMKEEYSKNELKDEADVLKHFGLIPKDMDYEAFTLSLLEEQVVGYYDPVQKKLFVAESGIQIGLEVILSHEIHHAIQDQHFDLMKFQSRDKENSDKTLAWSALIEGEGTAIMIDYMLYSTGKSFIDIPNMVTMIIDQLKSPVLMAIFSQAPKSIQETLLFPYIEGLKSMYYIRQRHPWSYIDAIYKKMPESTEQIMHPEKYETGEKAVTVVTSRDPDVPSSARLILKNVIGEFSFGLIFKEYLDRDTALKAADGWGGDQYLVFRKSGDGALIIQMETEWDTDNDAAEFYTAYRAHIPKRYPDATELKKGDNLDSWKTPIGVIRIKRNQRHIQVIEGLPISG